MIDFSDALSDEEEVAEYDPVSKKPVVWGKRIIRHLTQCDFEHLKLFNDVITRQEMDTVYFVVTRKLEWDELIAKHGQPIQVGTGPRGGFKWVRMTDDTHWGHANFRRSSLVWVKNYSRFRIKCNKEGKSLQPPRRTTGRSGKKR